MTEIEQLLSVLSDVLAYEEMIALNCGLSGCTCINYSRDTERAYEMGQCVHQRAREVQMQHVTFRPQRHPASVGGTEGTKDDGEP